LGAGEVVAPERTDLVLPADIPDVEFGVFVGYGFDVEADCGDCGYVLFEFEVVENCYCGGGYVSLVLEYEEGT
jgi:hypothetical protein